MQKRRILGYALLVGLTVSILFGSASTTFAITSSSPNYQVTETQFGTTQKSCSGQYCSQASIGEATNGKAMATSTANFEDITNNEPFLDMIIDPGISNLGTLSTESTATKTTSVKIRSYLSGGYTLQITGEPPKFDGHILYTSTTPVQSNLGTEQFGINVVKNTTPNVGENPLQVPAGQQAFGVVENNYNTVNMFMYQSEAVVARGITDTGRTDYTISMIVNISSSTPAGKYTGDFAAVVIPAF